MSCAIGGEAPIGARRRSAAVAIMAAITTSSTQLRFSHSEKSFRAQVGSDVCFGRCAVASGRSRLPVCLRDSVVLLRRLLVHSVGSIRRRRVAGRAFPASPPGKAPCPSRKCH